MKEFIKNLIDIFKPITEEENIIMLDIYKTELELLRDEYIKICDEKRKELESMFPIQSYNHWHTFNDLQRSYDNIHNHLDRIIILLNLIRVNKNKITTEFVENIRCEMMYLPQINIIN
jgi:hypothetical protein